MCGGLGLQHEYLHPFRVRWWQLLLHSPQVAWLLLNLLLIPLGSLREFRELLRAARLLDVGRVRLRVSGADLSTRGSDVVHTSGT